MGSEERRPADFLTGLPLRKIAQRVNGRPAAASRNQSAKPSVDYRQLRRTNMDKDRVVGAAHQVKGAVKEAVGKVTGDAKTQAEGAAEKTAGKVQNAAGGAKDAVRDSLKQ
jgi:uncharacterized protein YjbJ (UPF0337 family)